MLIPSTVIKLNESHPSFCHAASQQTICSKGARTADIAFGLDSVGSEAMGEAVLERLA